MVTIEFEKNMFGNRFVPCLFTFCTIGVEGVINSLLWTGQFDVINLIVCLLRQCGLCFQCDYCQGVYFVFLCFLLCQENCHFQGDHHQSQGIMAPGQSLVGGLAVHYSHLFFFVSVSSFGFFIWNHLLAQWIKYFSFLFTRNLGSIRPDWIFWFMTWNTHGMMSLKHSVKISYCGGSYAIICIFLWQIGFMLNSFMKLSSVSS